MDQQEIKIIFLDFDGVITTLKSCWELDGEKLTLLKEILDKTDCKIVLSTSWRLYTLNSTLNMLRDKKFPFIDKIIGITPRLTIHDTLKCTRGNEIKKWIDNNIVGNFKYVILDDTDDMLPEQKSFFILTDPIEGLSDKNVEATVQILNS